MDSEEHVEEHQEMQDIGVLRDLVRDRPIPTTSSVLNSRIPTSKIPEGNPAPLSPPPPTGLGLSLPETPMVQQSSEHQMPNPRTTRRTPARRADYHREYSISNLRLVHPQCSGFTLVGNYQTNEEGKCAAEHAGARVEEEKEVAWDANSSGSVNEGRDAGEVERGGEQDYMAEGSGAGTTSGALSLDTLVDIEG
ncbi:MAG: hypothetical protein MMC33_006230 [Icmadophila ericetorum]|nr:hypothetical protein [Icmadophila ericetorum]